MKSKLWKVCSIVLAFSLLLLVAACGNSDNQGSSGSGTDSGNNGGQQASSEFEPYTLKFGHHLAEDHILHKQVQKFAEILAEKTGGQVKVDIYPAGQLGQQKDLLEGLQLGTVDMTLVDTGVFANFYEPLAILDAPYLFDSVDQSVKALAGELGTKLKDGVYEKTGIRVLSFEPAAYRITVLVEDAVKDPNSFTLQDFKGLKIRTLDSPSVIKTFERFGAQPVSIPSGEVYTALQTHVVQGVESNPEFLRSIKIYEVSKYLVDTKHVLVHQAIGISDKTWNKLPENTRNAIQEAMDEATDWHNSVSKDADLNARDALKQAGMVFIEPDLQPFKEAAFPYTEQFVQEKGLQDLYELIKKAGE